MSDQEGKKEEAAPAANTRPAPEGRHVKIPIKTLILIGVMLVVVAKIHLVHGGGVGLKVCEKDGWGFDDTFVDLDDYIGKPLISQMDKARVLRAMFACGTLERPTFLDENRR